MIFTVGVWYFNRNEAYDANNYFTNLAGQPRPVFRLNEPGFNIGGPVWIPHVYNDVAEADVLLRERRMAAGSM